jgi:hypothetical protein
MLIKFTHRNATNLAVLIVAVFAAIFAGLAISSVVIIGILAMAAMKVFWVALDSIREVRDIHHRNCTDREAAEDYLLRRREHIAEHARELAGR